MKRIVTILILSLGVALCSAFAEDTYPLKTCIVSDEKLGENGKPYVFKHEGKEIQLCCKDCYEDFKKEPAKYLSKLPDAKK